MGEELKHKIGFPKRGELGNESASVKRCDSHCRDIVEKDQEQTS